MKLKNYIKLKYPDSDIKIVDLEKVSNISRQTINSVYKLCLVGDSMDDIDRIIERGIEKFNYLKLSKPELVAADSIAYELTLLVDAIKRGNVRDIADSYAAVECEVLPFHPETEDEKNLFRVYEFIRDGGDVLNNENEIILSLDPNIGLINGELIIKGCHSSFSESR